MDDQDQIILAQRVVPITEVLRVFFFWVDQFLSQTHQTRHMCKTSESLKTQKSLQQKAISSAPNKSEIIKTQPVQFSSTGASDCCSEREKLQGKLLQRVQAGIAREPHFRPCRYRVSRGETPMVLSFFLPRT